MDWDGAWGKKEVTTGLVWPNNHHLLRIKARNLYETRNKGSHVYGFMVEGNLAKDHLILPVYGPNNGNVYGIAKGNFLIPLDLKGGQYELVIDFIKLKHKGTMGRI